MKRLADGRGSLLEEPDYFGEQALRNAVAQRFPELKPELELDPGVHLAMSVLASATMHAANAGDLSRVSEIFAFLEEVLHKPRLHPEIPNAVAISYVAPSELRRTVVGAAALERMPASIQELIFSAEGR